MNNIPPIVVEPLSRLAELDPASALAIGDIATERLRQIEVEGWTLEHDEAHSASELANAAGCYALGLRIIHLEGGKLFELWPWAREWWKPTSPVRNRIKAGALLVAAMARHYRSTIDSGPKP